MFRFTIITKNKTKKHLPQKTHQQQMVRNVIFETSALFFSIFSQCHLCNLLSRGSMVKQFKNSIYNIPGDIISKTREKYLPK